MKHSSGTSIKFLSIALFALGSIASLFVAFDIADIFFSSPKDETVTGVIVFIFISILGIFLSWTSTICLRGFGELIENIAKLEAKVSALLEKQNDTEQ